MVFQKSKFEPNLNLALYDLLPFGPFVRSRLTLTNKNTVANIFTWHENVRIRWTLIDGSSIYRRLYLKNFRKITKNCGGLYIGCKP